MLKVHTACKVFKYGVFYGPSFSAFGLNTERYSVSLRIQSECGKIRTRKNSVFGYFSRSDSYANYVITHMIASTQITNTEIFAFIDVRVFELLSRKVLFINRKSNRNC